MNKKHNAFLINLSALFFMTGVAINQAQAIESNENETQEIKLFKQAKISLSEAIKAAEQKTGGKAMEAEVDDETNNIQFEVETIKEDKIYVVMVDGRTGQVLTMTEGEESDEGAENEKD